MDTLTTVRLRATLPFVLALLITAYGAILRLDVINLRYGPIDHPAWARVVTQSATPLARHVKPVQYWWHPDPTPYVGGDPYSYIRHAREMRSFYQAHVREPVFLAITRAFLWLTDWQDVGISFASATMSTLCIFATFLLGRAAFSTPVGLLAALALAIEFDEISWAADGWRDDTFTCMLLLTAWALVRLRQQPTRWRAGVAGVLGAAACLTRITSISWLVPALLLVCIDGPRVEWRRRAALVSISALITAVLVAPYLIACAREMGDSLISINAHTVYYRAGEGVSFQAPMSASSYIASKIAERPIRQIDTAITGIFVWPMTNKWASYNVWIPYAGRVLEMLAIAGLLLFLSNRNGRLLLGIALTSLVPYAFTWNIAGGREWRFVMHVYPIYLMAAWYTVEFVVRGARALRDPPRRQALRRPRAIATGAGAAAAIALTVFAYGRLPYLVYWEALRKGDEVTIPAGNRDGAFYSKGWSPWNTEGAVTARVVLGTRGTIALPLPERRPYRITMRIDPATPAEPRNVSVLLNGRFLKRLGLEWNPQRVGSYSVDVEPEFVRPGAASLQLVADSALPARAAGPRYAWIDPDTPVSLRVWYVRIHPL